MTSQKTITFGYNKCSSERYMVSFARHEYGTPKLGIIFSVKNIYVFNFIVFKDLYKWNYNIVQLVELCA